MTIVRRHFSSILDDNTETYFKYLEGIVSSVDINASVEITKRINGINVRIAPSEVKYFTLLKDDVERVHNLLKLRLDYSKSMKSSGTINYNIDFQNNV